MLLFRALAKNMAPMTHADESPTNRLTLFPIYLSLFIVSTLWRNAANKKPSRSGRNVSVDTTERLLNPGRSTNRLGLLTGCSVFAIKFKTESCLQVNRGRYD